MAKREQEPVTVIPKSTLRVELMSLDECTAMRHRKNPKEHDIASLVGSFRRFGFVAPPTIDEHTQIMVAGHGRCEALSSMRPGGENERDERDPKNVRVGEPPNGIIVVDGRWMVPVIRGVSFTNEKERDAYVVADNQHTIQGGWNLDLLTETLQSLRDVGFDGLGFDDIDLGSLLKDNALLEETKSDTWSATLGIGSGEDEPGAQQKSFVLSKDQIKVVDRALAHVKGTDLLNNQNTGNRNANGNAIAFICAQYLARVEGNGR